MRLCLFVVSLVLSSCACSERVVLDAALSMSPAALDFGLVAPRGVAEREVAVRNEGGRDAVVTLEFVDATRPAAFSVRPSSFSLSAGETTAVTVHYQGASALSADVAALVLREVDSAVEVRVSLAGRTGAAAADAGEADAGEADAGAVDAGEADAGAVDAGAVDAGAVDAGFDAGVDAGLELPVFDGGGLCGNHDVIELPFLVGPPYANDVRSRPSIVPVGDEYALAWQESRDAGVGVLFARVTPAGRLVLGPKWVRPGGDRGVQMAFNGRELGLAQSLSDPSQPPQTPSEFVEFVRLDLDGNTLSALNLGSFYRPGMTAQSVGWNAHDGEWGLGWGWWPSQAASSFQRISAAGALVGSQVTYSPSEVPWRSRPLIAASDGGYVMVDLQGSVGASRLRRLDADGGVVSSVSLQGSVIGGDGLKAVQGGQTFGVAWRRYDGNNRLEFTVVTPTGAFSVRTLAAQSVGNFDLVWNGAGYTVLASAFDGTRWGLSEWRFDELAQQVGTRRWLTCSGGAADVSLAFSHGLHFATWQDAMSGDVRLLTFP